MHILNDHLPVYLSDFVNLVKVCIQITWVGSIDLLLDFNRSILDTWVSFEGLSITKGCIRCLIMFNYKDFKIGLSYFISSDIYVLPFDYTLNDLKL